MKKNILLLWLCLFFHKGFTQQYFPSYPEVLREFYSRYNYDNNTDTDYSNYLNFAKKRDGWYVQKIDRIKNDELKNEIIFWPSAGGGYADLRAQFESQNSPENAEKNIKSYLDGSGGVTLWIEYQRCKYSGYKGWEEDMIADFGSAANLPDTLLEGLARAYSFKASSYLWYMNGSGQDAKDTLQAKLGRIQLPSEQRIDKVIFYINKAVETYARLEKQNPAYTTLIGNISLRKFNECVNGYMQMDIALQPKKAREFLVKAVLDEPYILQAKNYLNSCDPNAILFSFGDNDTYQLWYVQQMLNYRKDVSVINTSLLGLASYIQMLNNKKEVVFTTPMNFIEKNSSDVTYILKPEDAESPVKITLPELLKQVYKGAEKDTPINILHVNQDIKLSVEPDRLNKISGIKNMGSDIYFHINNYLQLNELAELDIISANINTRPIFFTTTLTNFFDSSLVQQGIVYRLLPLKRSAREEVAKAEMANLESYTDKIYKPVVSFISNHVKQISIDGNNCFFWQYSKIASYHIDKGDTLTARRWLDKAFKLFPLEELSVDNMPGVFVLGETLMNAGDKERSTRTFELYADFLYKKYEAPSASNGYLSKPALLTELNNLNNYLRYFGITSPGIRDKIQTLQD